MNQVKKIVSDYPVTSGIIGLGILIFGGRAIRKAMQPGPNIPPVPPIPTPSPIPNQQSKYTYGAQQYADFADGLFNAMEGTGTYENDVAKILSAMKTYDDVLALNQAYGRREIARFWDWGWTSTSAMTLAQSFKSEMSSSEIARYVNEPLRKTGYQFPI